MDSREDDGEQALAVLESEPPDVMVLDLKMPGIDGIEVLRRVKDTRPDIEVIILTGYGGIDSAVEATKLGAYAYLEKPYNFENLLEVLQKAFETRLKKKFEHDKKRMEEIEMLSMGTSPMGILRSLMHLDDDDRK